MLSLSGISKAYGGRTLFADVSLQVNRADRIGLVGPNGAGKSTLFSIMLGTLEPDDGKISKERGVSFGYLPQETAAVGDETVIALGCALQQASAPGAPSTKSTLSVSISPRSKAAALPQPLLLQPRSPLLSAMFRPEKNPPSRVARPYLIPRPWLIFIASLPLMDYR